MEVIYYSHAGAQTGYGRAARDYQEALLTARVGVAVRQLKEAAPHEYQKATVLYHGSPVQLAALAAGLPAKDQRKSRYVAVTTWETDFFPASFAMALNHYDAVVVPSIFCAVRIDNSRNLVSDKPVKKSFVVPHCFNPDEWNAVDHPQGDTFTFYSIGGWGERKNMLGVLKAYLHAFSKSDRVRLALIINGADFDVIRSVIARSALSPTDIPGMVIPDGSMPPTEIVQLHQDADCFVSTTRGEGWGLGMFEALIMQRTVIAPGFGGQLDFLDGFDGTQWWPVSYQKTPIFAGEGEVVVSGPAVSGKLTLPRGADAKQLWADPDLEQIARRMRQIFEEGNRDYSRFADGREELEDRYSTPVVGQKLASVLKEISGS